MEVHLESCASFISPLNMLQSILQLIMHAEAVNVGLQSEGPVGPPEPGQVQDVVWCQLLKLNMGAIQHLLQKTD
jgi:hypothetical protein